MPFLPGGRKYLAELTEFAFWMESVKMTGRDLETGAGLAYKS